MTTTTVSLVLSSTHLFSSTVLVHTAETVLFISHDTGSYGVSRKRLSSRLVQQFSQIIPG